MLYVKNLVFLDAAIARLAPDLDILAEIANISVRFATRTASDSGGTSASASTSRRSTWMASRRASASTQCPGPHPPRVASPPRPDRGTHGARAAGRASPAVRIVIARCSVDYDGRLTRTCLTPCGSSSSRPTAASPSMRWWRLQAAELDERTEHAVEGDDTWIVTNPKGERLTITMHGVLADSRWELGPDPAQKTASRRTSRSCSWRGRTPSRSGFGSSAASTRRRSARSTWSVATRTATLSPSRSSAGARSTASSSWRATSSGRTSTPRSATPRGFRRPGRQAAGPVLAEARGFRWIEVHYDELRGLAPTDLTLF